MACSSRSTSSARTCDPPCAFECCADFDGDFAVGVTDLLFLLASWGTIDSCGENPPDFNGDGDVDHGDLMALLSMWGPC